ncbi:efflux RND transporter periplasmic adaptor subunit [Vibrio sp. WXL103]|uniref:efflux RND transporter periplasmic adaptor subunit n=1 Tax=unclassified Vibrio TaxID=2614977 RepID=UPI003EC5D227
MNKTLLVSLFSLGLMLSVPSVQARGPGGSPAITVVTEYVDAHAVSQSLSLVGKLQSEYSVDLAPEVQGRVDVIHVRANQKVKKNQLLLTLNADRAQATLAEAQAYLKDEQRKLAEFERLVARNAITQTEIDAQKASVSIAQARLDVAQAGLNDHYLRAPFAGTIGFIDFSRGQLVNPGDSLLSLDDLSMMELDLQVPERYLSQIEPGLKVSATTAAWGNTIFEGEVIAIDSRINQETLNLRVRIQFENRSGQLKPGMLVSSFMAFPPIEAPIIPVQALEYSGTKRYVYVINDDNTASRREVLLGARIENEVVIEEGLEIGEQIVVQGIVNMRDGVAVSVLGEQAQTQSKPESAGK